MNRRLRTEHLVNGLTFDERLSKLEARVFGTRYELGLDRDHDETRDRLKRLEDARRPWWLRLLVWRR